MKRLLKPLWNLARPLRSALAGRLDAVVYAATVRALETSEPARRMTEEVSLVLDAVVAEQVRLREQVESLEDEIRALLAARGEDSWLLTERKAD
jgi:hypothetical protein